jgi:alkaline phosphatase
MKKYAKWMLSGALLTAVASAPLLAQPKGETPEQWYANGAGMLRQELQEKPNENRAKNVILFVGDGMGITTVTAARIFDGQLRGESGEENSLSFERLPYVALAKTYNTDQQVPDSAGTMTAIMTGVKTKAGLISVNQNAQRGNCKSEKGNDLQTFLEQAEKAGKSTGVVTTTRITHATPAATYAHSPDRNWESDHDMPAAARQEGCKDIARQLLELRYGNGLEVALGGGRAKFLPATSADPQGAGAVGEREDGRDLTAEWQKKYRNAAYVWNQQQLEAVNAAKVDHLLGLFNRADMGFDADRKTAVGVEPSLSEMTAKAIAILKKNPQGFFLMVEGGRIDHAHHMGNAYHALDETREFANAVNAALRLTDTKNTLVIVTADHGSTLNISGYPKRGNPILGKVIGTDSDQPAPALDGKPYTTLGYMNGPGGIAERNAASLEHERRDLADVDTQKPDYLQQALVPLAQETHSGADVPIYAGGPWAHLFHRTYEQNYIFQVMHYAINAPAKAVPGKKKARRAAKK